MGGRAWLHEKEREGVFGMGKTEKDPVREEEWDQGPLGSSGAKGLDGCRCGHVWGPLISATLSGGFYVGGPLCSSPQSRPGFQPS